ncbi:MAG: PKD domain-containing protein [Bacteroidota bacterium]
MVDNFKIYLVLFLSCFCFLSRAQQVIPPVFKPVITADVEAYCADEGTPSSTLTVSGNYDEYWWYKNNVYQSVYDGEKSIELGFGDAGVYKVRVENNGTLSEFSDPIEIKEYNLGVSLEAIEACGSAELIATSSVNHSHDYLAIYKWYHEGSFLRSTTTNSITVYEYGDYTVEFSLQQVSDCAIVFQTENPNLIGNNVIEPPSNPCFECMVEARVSVTAEIPDIANAGPDDETCGLVYNLNAQPPFGRIGTWSQVSGPGSSVFTNPTSPTSSVTVSVIGAYVFRWNLNAGDHCPANSDDVVITFEEADFSIQIPESCNSVGSPVNMNLLGGPAGMNYSIDWGDGSIQNTSATSVSHIYSSTGTYNIFVGGTTAGTCTASNSTTVTINSQVAAGPDANVCSFSTQLEASAVGGGSKGVWSQVGGPSITSFGNLDSPSSNIFVPVAGTYTYRWTVTNSSCSDQYDEVSITFTGVDFDLFLDNACPDLSDPVVLNIQNNASRLLYQIDWGDGTTQITSDKWVEHYYSTQGNYQVTVTSTVGPCTHTVQTEVILVSLCATAVPENGQFKLDAYTGVIYFERPNCEAELPFSCLIGPSKDIEKVVTAGAVEFDHKWRHSYTDTDKSAPGNALQYVNIYERGERGHWRVSSANNYKTDLIEDDKNYRYGTYNLKTFSWDVPQTNTWKWIKSARVLAYSPNGDALLERNALNINSTVKFGYDDAVPVVTATNVDGLSTFYFESFEISYGDSENGRILEDFGRTWQGRLDNNKSHSGAYSLELEEDDIWKMRDIQISSQLYEQGLIVKLWVNYRGQIEDLFMTVADAADDNQLAIKGLSEVAHVGEWSLLETYISATDFQPLEVRDKMVLSIVNDSPFDAWLDDVKFQPADAQITCYVYASENLKLATVYDDMHFGLYYKYNGTGQLVRKMVETERGIKTIQEIHYNIAGE